MVNVVCPSRYKINRLKIKSASNESLQKHGVASHYGLNIVFIGRTKMKSIAGKYKKEREALPVLSFAYDHEKDNLLGEVFICYPQAVLLAAERNKTVEVIINSLVEHGIENILK